MPISEQDGRVRSPSPNTVAEFRLLPGVAEAVTRLKAAGFLTVVITNQPDVATGRTSPATVSQAMPCNFARRHARWTPSRLCAHTDADKCACRKPLPGMLLEAAKELDIDLGPQLHGGRPLARYPGRHCGRVPHNFRGFRPFSRGPAPAGPYRTFPSRGRFFYIRICLKEPGASQRNQGY